MCSNLAYKSLWKVGIGPGPPVGLNHLISEVTNYLQPGWLTTTVLGIIILGTNRHSHSVRLCVANELDESLKDEPGGIIRGPSAHRNREWWFDLINASRDY